MGCLTTSLQASSRAGLAICQSQIVFVLGPLSLTSERGARQTANVSDRASRFRVLASCSGTGICISTVSVSRQSSKPVRLSVTATARDLPWRGLLQLRCAPGRRSGPRGRGFLHISAAGMRSRSQESRSGCCASRRLRIASQVLGHSSRIMHSETRTTQNLCGCTCKVSFTVTCRRNERRAANLLKTPVSRELQRRCLVLGRIASG
jgi:hypothetical protein